MIPNKRLPLTVIGGFLGAGKTTLLNRLLAEANGRRLAVLVNDFGALNIDAELVASRGADAIALSNGCVCCAIGDDLSAALMRVLDAEPAFDALVIEASGVSDPWRIAQVGMTDPALALGGVVVLVDAAEILRQAADPLLADSLRRQVQAADWILINKTDLTNREQLSLVQAWIDEQAPGRACFQTRHAALPQVLVSALFDEPERVAAAIADRIERHACDGSCGDHGQTDHHHSHHKSGVGDAAEPDHGVMFESSTWRPEAVLSAQTLRTLLRNMPVGVLRLKGFVCTDVHDWAEVQFAGQHGSLRRALQAPDRAAGVVAIGLRGRLPKLALDAVFGPAVGAKPHRHGEATNQV